MILKEKKKKCELSVSKHVSSKEYVDIKNMFVSSHLIKPKTFKSLNNLGSVTKLEFTA